MKKETDFQARSWLHSSQQTVIESGMLQYVWAANCQETPIFISVPLLGRLTFSSYAVGCNGM